MMADSNDLTRKHVQRALRRMLWLRLLACGSMTLLGAGALALLLVGVVKLAPVPAWLWSPPVWATLAGAAVLAALAWTWLSRPSRDAAALEVDRRFGLRERVSTALATSGSTDPFARAVQDDAAAELRGKSIGSHFRLRPTPMMGLWALPVVAASDSTDSGSGGS